MRSLSLSRALFCAVVAIGLCARPASADILTDYAFRITGTSSAGSDTWRVDIGDVVFNPDGGFDWTLETDIDLIAPGGELIGTLSADNNTTSVTVISDPVLGLNFNVTAGPLGGSFTISAPVLSFSPLLNPDASASAGISVSDLGGDGLSRTGGFGGVESYRAVTNGFVGGANDHFADLVDNVTGPAFATLAENEANPVAGFVTIPGAVSSMHAEFQFDLGPNDNAAGTSVFVVVPEPMTAMLLIGGAGVLIHRRRA